MQNVISEVRTMSLNGREFGKQLSKIHRHSAKLSSLLWSVNEVPLVPHNSKVHRVANFAISLTKINNLKLLIASKYYTMKAIL